MYILVFHGHVFLLVMFASSHLQDRSKISKLHMAETVEELKKFNARRKLKVKMNILL